MGLNKIDRGSRIQLTVILSETVVQTEIAQGNAAITGTKERTVNRYQFYEIMIRMAIFLYTDQTAKSKMFDRKDGHLILQEYQQLTPSQAWHCFLEYVLRPFCNENKLNWQRFRFEELWVHDVELLITINNAILSQLFKKYCKQGNKYLQISDLEQMMYHDCQLGLKLDKIRNAFSMSKMTVV